MIDECASLFSKIIRAVPRMLRLAQMDPFRIQHEPLLTEEQEEYFRRTRQEWIHPATSN
ncbi:MAG: hypothetical protein WBF33_12410 [Candidatus Nitrosopolaris sp.]